MGTIHAPRVSRKTPASIATLLILVAVLTAGGVSPVRGQEPAQPVSSNEKLDPMFGPGPEMAPVEVDGVVLFSLRGVSSYPAQQRATDVAGRIRRVARNRAFDPDKIQVVEDNGISGIQAGDEAILSIVDADAFLEGIRRTELSQVVAERVKTAIRNYRSDRSAEVLTRSGLRTLGLIVILVLFLFLWLRFSRWVDKRVARRLKARVKAMGVDSLREGSTERVGELLGRAVRGVRDLVFLIAIAGFLQRVLGLFPWTRAIHARLGSWIIGPLETMVAALLEQIPSLIFLAILFIVIRWTLGLVRLFFTAVERGTITLSGFDPEWSNATYKIARLGVIGFGLVVAYPYIPGSDTDAFKGVSLFAGVLFSLGSSSVISNVIAGYTMTYRRAFRVGDWVRIGEVVGEVSEIKLQITRVRTPKNEDIVIPNSMILAGEVTNFTTLAKTRGLVLHTEVGIGYDTPWRQVEAMLRLAADRTDGFLTEPAPFVLQKSLGDFCIVYELNVYTDRPQKTPALYSALHRSILDVFNEYGVQIMSPAYVGDPAQEKIVARENWHLEPASEEAASSDQDR